MIVRTMLGQICLTPYNPDKALRPIIDGASTEDLGFVLFQWTDELDPSKSAMIISANCSRLKETQLRFSPIEENLGESCYYAKENSASSFALALGV